MLCTGTYNVFIKPTLISNAVVVEWSEYPTTVPTTAVVPLDLFYSHVRPGAAREWLNLILDSRLLREHELADQESNLLQDGLVPDSYSGNSLEPEKSGGQSDLNAIVTWCNRRRLNLLEGWERIKMWWAVWCVITKYSLSDKLRKRFDLEWLDTEQFFIKLGTRPGLLRSWLGLA